MTVIIHSNYAKPNTVEILKKVEKIFNDFNVNVIHNDDSDESVKKCDFIITIGGDGTIIHHAKKAAIFKKPILGINSGRFGYLADIEPFELDQIAELINGNYKIEDRMMLKVTINNNDYYCLNDAVISKGAASRMIDILVTLNDDTLKYRADGIISATPTGSTAYSLSAGGPALDPAVESIVLTPICSQNALVKSVILNPDTHLMFKVSCPDKTDAYLTIDGEKVIKLSDEDIVEIQKENEVFVKLIKLKNKTFFNKLSEKLKVGEQWVKTEEKELLS